MSDCDREGGRGEKPKGQHFRRTAMRKHQDRGGRERVSARWGRKGEALFTFILGVGLKRGIPDQDCIASVSLLQTPIMFIEQLQGWVQPLFPHGECRALETITSSLAVYIAIENVRSWLCLAHVTAYEETARQGIAEILV